MSSFTSSTGFHFHSLSNLFHSFGTTNCFIQPHRQKSHVLMSVQRGGQVTRPFQPIHCLGKWLFNHKETLNYAKKIKRKKHLIFMASTSAASRRVLMSGSSSTCSKICSSAFTILSILSRPWSQRSSTTDFESARSTIRESTWSFHQPHHKALRYRHALN